MPEAQLTDRSITRPKRGASRRRSQRWRRRSRPTSTRSSDGSVNAQDFETLLQTVHGRALATATRVVDGVNGIRRGLTPREAAGTTGRSARSGRPPGCVPCAAATGIGPTGSCARVAGAGRRVGSGCTGNGAVESPPLHVKPDVFHGDADT